MLKNYKMLATLLALLIACGLDAQTFPVNWLTLKNAEVVSGVIRKESFSENIGVGISQQLLFGHGDGNVFSGYFEFTVSTENQIKKIGFTTLDNPDEALDVLTYGFTFLGDGKVTAFGVNGVSSEISFTIGDVFRLERVEERELRFFINGTMVYVEQGDASESYQINANLISDDASFENVSCSYETTPFSVVPEIDNVNKTIRLAISGAYPPYTYTWGQGPRLVGVSKDDPSGEPLYQVQTDGNYDVEINDALGNRFEKRYSIGSDIYWSSLYQTVVNGDVLSYTGSSNWGSAVHFSSFSSNSNGWVEYVLDHTSGKRAFGFVDATQIVRTTRDLKAGFLITDEAIQVISNGNVIYKGDYEDMDVLTLHYIEGKVFWMKNGVEFFVENYSSSGDFTIAGLLIGNGTEKHLNHSFNSDSYITKNWTESKESGSVQVDIASLNISGPYHYMISKDHIPELSEIYSYLTDSNGVTIDSLSFFTGSETSTNFTFDNLDAGTYNISVFDSQGRRILGKEIELFGEFTIEDGTGLIVAGNTIQSSQDNSAGSLKLYLTQGENLGVEVELIGDEVQQFIGFAQEQVTVNGYQDLEYGFYLNRNELYTVESGVLSSSYEVIRQNKSLTMTIQDGELVLNGNMEDLARIQLPEQYIFKIGIGMDLGAIMQLNYPAQSLKKKPYRFSYEITNHLNCANDQLGGFSFSIIAWKDFYSPTIPYSIVNTETNQSVISNGVYYEGVTSSIDQYANGTPLTAGAYTISFTLAGQVYSYQIYLGYEADWAQHDAEYLEDPNSFSLKVSPQHDELSFLQGRSNNIMKFNEEGWIEFTPVLQNVGTSRIRPTTLNLNTLNSISLLSEEFALLYKQNVFNNYYWMQAFSPSQGYGTFFTVFDNARIKMVFTIPGASVNGEVLIYVDGVWKETIDRGNSSIIARFNSIMSGDGFKDVVTSFPCPEPSDIYAHLKYKMDGFHHTMKEGEIKFVFDQEYSDALLTFNIYDQEDNLVKTQADFPPITTTHGDNYLLLDISANGEFLDEGFFYLEVINSKKEKLYLRFYNDY